MYRDNVGVVFGHAYARRGNSADAEDVTAQVFLRALPHLNLAAADPELRGYLIATARTVLAEFWTAKYRLPLSRLHEALAVAPLRSDDDDSDALRHRVAAVLARLPERHRTVLELRFLRGYSVKEVAGALGISTSNAKVTQWRALRHAGAILADAL